MSRYLAVCARLHRIIHVPSSITPHSHRLHFTLYREKSDRGGGDEKSNDDLSLLFACRKKYSAQKQGGKKNFEKKEPIRIFDVKCKQEKSVQQKRRTKIFPHGITNTRIHIHTYIGHIQHSTQYHFSAILIYPISHTC